MNEKIIGWIAAAVISGLVGSIFKYDLLSVRQLQIVVVLTFGAGILLHIVAMRKARYFVVRRRRMYRDLWRICAEAQAAREHPGLDLSEEESVKLLGRIKGRKIIMKVIAFATVVLLFRKHLWALVPALSQVFLAGMLHLRARNLDRVLPPDSERDPPSVMHAGGDPHTYLITIDLKAVHDFIAPRTALPFWSVAEAEKWLAHCGFRRTLDGRWAGDRDALRFLDADEIISIEGVARGPEVWSL